MAGLGILPALSRAADIHWDAADGNWDVATNWAGGVVPGNADRGILDRAAGGMAHVTTDTVDVKGVSVANGNALSVETGGNVTTIANSPDDNPADGIWIADGSAGTASVTDDGRLATTGGGYQGTIGVGRGGGTGTLTVNGATASVDAQDVHIGGSNLPGDIASPGTGTLDLQNGTVNARAWSFVGRNGGTGTFNQSGGSMSTNGWTNIGFAGGTGTYNLSGGSYNSDSDTNIGVDPGSVGIVHQTGGTLSSGGWTFVGKNGGSGEYNLSDGVFNPRGNFNVGHQNAGTGTFNQTGGLVDVGESIHVGRDSGHGTYNLIAGTMDIGNPGGPDPDLIVGADAGSTGTLNQTGGTIAVTRWGFVGRNNGNGVVNQSAGTYTSNGWLRVAEGSGSVGTYNLSGTAVANIGGGDDDTGDDDIVLGIDPLANGTLNVSDTAVLNAARDMLLGFVGGNGAYSQTSGDVNVARDVMVGTTGSLGGVEGVGTASVTGGTLDVGGNLVAGLAAPIDSDPDPAVVVLVPTIANGEINIGGTANVTVAGNTIAGEAAFEGSTAMGVINQSGGALTTGGIIVAANPGATGDFNISGGTLTSLSTTNNGTFDASGTAVATLGPVGGSGAVTVADTAVVNADHIRQASLDMTGGRVNITETTTGAASGVSVIPAYTLSGNARLDLTDNKLITDMPAGSATAGVYDGVHRDVQRAYNFTNWDQPGLMTSKADAKQGLTTIGISTGRQIRGLGETDTALWGGQTITGASTLAMYTYAGDANLDGQIDAGDYGIIDNFVQIAGASGYGNGDFNYDGFIDAGDYGIIDNNIQAQTTPFSTSGAAAPAGLSSGVTAVPEPASLSVVGLAAIGLLGRRRRTK